MPGRCIGVYHITGRLVYYYILTNTGSVVSRSNVKHVTNIELHVTTVEETLIKYVVEIHQCLKADCQG